MKYEKHPCLCCKGLVFTTYKLELGESLETQKDSNIGFPAYGKCFETEMGLASTCLNPLRFVTESLLPCLLPREDTLQQ